MLFTSYRFLLFLVVVFFVYYRLPKAHQWKWLLASSLFFYGAASLSFLATIGVTTVTTFLGALLIEKISIQGKEAAASLSGQEKREQKSLTDRQKKRVFLFTLLLNFGLLATLKYTNFAIENLNGLVEAFSGGFRLRFVHLVMPMGISFYTFQSMGYLIDVYRGKQEAVKHLGKFSLFVTFFPQLIQGPISRFEDLSSTLFSGQSYDGAVFAEGLRRILWGFFKKLVIADRLIGTIKVLTESPEQFAGSFVFLAMVLYSFQLYADFTGGIDITLGIAKALGIVIKENFNRPYLARDIADFWRRWHITMGTWFRDYVFYPLSVSKPMLKFSKFSRKKLGRGFGKRLPVYITTMVVWFTTGLWHGASWNFIVWGLMNGLVIVLSMEMKPFYEAFHRRFDVTGKKSFVAFQVVRTFLLMSAIRLFDIYRDVPLTFRMFSTIFTTPNLDALLRVDLETLALTGADLGVLFFGFFAMATVSLYQTDWPGSRRKPLPRPIAYATMAGMLVAILVFGAYGVGYDANQFIYNQF